MWKLNAFLNERAPRVLGILQNFTAMEWIGICLIPFIIYFAW